MNSFKINHLKSLIKSYVHNDYDGREKTFVKEMETSISDIEELLQEKHCEILDLKAELTAHKAKINELKEWCKDHSRNTAATKYDRYWKGYQESAIFIFQKLEELDK